MNRSSATFRAAPAFGAAVLVIGVVAAGVPSAASARPSSARAHLARAPISSEIASSNIQNSEMYAVTVAPKSTDEWVLTENRAFGKTTSSDVVLSHIGSRWKRLKVKGTPNVATLTLNGVAAGSPKAIWAVGYRETTSNPVTAQIAPVLARSTGGTFKVTKIKGVKTGELFTAAASSPTNAWAIGVSGQFTADLSLHWNGKRWSKIPLRSAATGVISSSTVVSTSGPKNAWLLSQGSGAAVIEHWNGAKWKVMPAPEGSPQLTSIATSGGSTWVVGSIAVGAPSVVSAYAARWTGTAWKEIKLADAASNMLQSVTATGSTAYAVGRDLPDATTGSDVQVAARLHGNKGAVRPIKAVGKFTAPNAVAASSKAVMAVGYYEAAGYCMSPFHSFAETLVHATWKKVRIPASLVPASATGYGLCS